MHVPIIIDQVVAVFAVMIIDNGRVVGCLTLPIYHHSATHTCCIILSVGQQGGTAYTTIPIQALRCAIRFTTKMSSRVTSLSQHPPMSKPLRSVIEVYLRVLKRRAGLLALEPQVALLQQNLLLLLKLL